MRSSALTSALINTLWADATLRALTPDGVFKDVASASLATGGEATRFVIVSRVLTTPVRVFGKRAYLDALYLVEARMLSSAGGDIHAAADAIDQVLDPTPPDPPASFPIPGFALMACYQDDATEQTEFDDADPSRRWLRCGGHYRLWAAPVTP